jgi:hypothetical protein
MKRRTFLQGALASAGLISLISSIANSEERRRGGAPAATAGAALVDPKDPAAKAVSYVHKNTEIKDKALMVDRTGVKFKDQKCLNCSFYQKDKESTVAGKKAAPCLMPFATGKVVASEGWCSSWAKKA